MLEVIAGVGVGHEDVLAISGFDPGDEGCAVAAGGDIDDAGAFGEGDGLGAVGAAVIGYYYFACDAAGLDRVGGLADAEG